MWFDRIGLAMALDATARRDALGVRAVDAAQAAAWDEYVGAHPHATFFHQFGWAAVLATLGHRPVLLAAWEGGGRIRGVLPICAVRDLRGRAGIYSLPSTVYGGALADDRATEAALLDAAGAIGREAGAGRLELRNRYRAALDLPALPGFLTFERTLAPTPALVASFGKGARAAVAQAERFGLEIRHDESVEAFYPLLASTYRRHGTPLYPRRFLHAIRTAFPEHSEISVIRHRGRAVAGALVLRFRDVAMPLFSAGTGEGRRLRADNWKTLRLMERARDLGAQRFDFGRSRAGNLGAIAFKRDHGCAAIALPYQVAGAAPGEGPSADPHRGLYPLLRRVWSLLPAAWNERCGAALLRRLP
jgi:FemAB-related protein (PEP-CTERM system-associated)